MTWFYKIFLNLRFVSNPTMRMLHAARFSCHARHACSILKPDHPDWTACLRGMSVNSKFLGTPFNSCTGNVTDVSTSVTNVEWHTASTKWVWGGSNVFLLKVLLQHSRGRTENTTKSFEWRSNGFLPKVGERPQEWQSVLLGGVTWIGKYTWSNEVQRWSRTI